MDKFNYIEAWFVWGSFVMISFRLFVFFFVCFLHFLLFINHLATTKAVIVLPGAGKLI